MHFKSSLVAFVALATAAMAQMINTPAALTECVPTRLSWSGGQAPYFLNIIPGGEVSAAPLKQFGQVAGTSLTWVVDLPASTSITLALTDSGGNTVYSSPVTIQAGTTTDCLNPNNSSAQTVAGSSTGTETESTTEASSTPATTSSQTTSQTTTPATSSSPPTSSSPAPSSSSGEKTIYSAGALILAAVLPLFA